MTVEVFIKHMKTAGWETSGGWKAEDLNGVPPGNYDVEFKDSTSKVILVKGASIYSLHVGTFPDWIKDVSRDAYKSNFIQIF